MYTSNPKIAANGSIPTAYHGAISSDVTMKAKGGFIRTF
jgi:hypothetical protein